jgi:hypothetical protein
VGVKENRFNLLQWKNLCNKNSTIESNALASSHYAVSSRRESRRKTICQHLHWKTIQKEVKQICSTCPMCQKNKKRTLVREGSHVISMGKTLCRSHWTMYSQKKGQTKLKPVVCDYDRSRNRLMVESMLDSYQSQFGGSKYHRGSPVY